jgi:glycosyltransferase involved in cell wall biosynthesis
VVARKNAKPQSYRVLMIAPTSFFSDYGCSVRILEEARSLQRHGHQIVVCTYRNGQDLPGLTIRRTPSIPFRERYEVGSSLHKIAFDLLLFWTVLFEAVRHRPDLIHAHMHEGALIGLIIGKLLRIPVVFDFQGSLTSEMLDHKFLRRDSPFYRFLYWLETRLDRLPAAVLTSSHNARSLLIEEFGCHPDRIHTVPDCVDTEAFYPRAEDEQATLAALRMQLGVPPGRKTVVYLGLLADYQGTDALLQAAKHLNQEREDVHFLIMGFPAVEHYQQMAQQLGIDSHTTFTGKVPYAEARDFLALGDVAVAPKLSATEGYGKILNYMAMGLPTVAFDTPVSREYLGDLGLYAKRGDPESLAKTLLLGLSGRVYEQRGAELRQVAASSYSWDRATRMILDVYHAVCGKVARVL